MVKSMMRSADLADSPGYILARASRLFASLNEQRLRPLEIGVAYIPVLAALSGKGPLSQKDLAQMAHIEQPTMAQLLNRMERAGFIERRGDPKDKRSSLVFLTELAQDRLSPGRSALAQTNKDALRNFSKEESTELARLLHRVIQNLKDAPVTPP